MTTYQSIQYNVLSSVMNYLNSPVTGLADLLKDTNISNSYIQDILQNLTDDTQTPLPSDIYQEILNFLQDIPELNLNNSKTIILKIQFEDEIATGKVEIISINLDNSKTYITKLGIGPLIPIKLPKFPTLGKCRDCLKLTFGSDNNYNFTGNIGASYLGSFRNGQKQYTFNLPDFSTPANYGNTIQYIIFWRPSVTYSGLDYFGNPITITNQNKWIAVPSASIGTSAELSNTTFFHRNTYISGSTIEQAVCPYYKSNSPLTLPYYNFIGRTGNYLLEVIQSLPDKPCASFIPLSGSVIWGYNCGDNGCVEGVSGSVQYATLAECQNAPCTVNTGGCPPDCPPPSTGSDEYGWACYGASTGNPYCIQVLLPSVFTTYATEEECAINCNPQYGVNCDPNTGQCIAGTVNNTGSFTSYTECEETGCNQILPATCSCDPTNNIVTNSSFGNGIASWGPSYNPNSGTWNFSQGYAQSIVTTQLDPISLTSSMYLSQNEVLNVSCSYSLCFEAWQTTPNASSTIAFNGSYLPNQVGAPVPANQVFTGLSLVPTAFSCSFVAGTNNFAFHLGVAQGTVGRINIDNVCITLIGCPPAIEEDCVISGSAYCYEDVEYDCLCPIGYTASLNGDCVPTGSITVPKIITGISYPTTLTAHSCWGWGKPVLYEQFNTSGISPSSIGNPTSLFNNPNVYNTQYRFDILKNPFWNANAPYNNGSCVWTNYQNRPINQYMIDVPLSQTWQGGGSFIEVTSSKTMYACLAADDVFRLKLNGNTVVELNSGNLSAFNQMHINSRSPGFNPYTNTNLGVSTGLNYPYICYHIFPFTMPSGCNAVTLESKDVNNGAAGFSGFIFNNTATEIAAATSFNDLNILWQADQDIIYDLNFGITASCPTGSTPLGPEPCDDCTTAAPSIPCGDCIECFNGILYNGMIVDAGGRSLLGRGYNAFPSNNTGIVNINPTDNPINTWYIPDEAAWDTLITYLNNGTAPSTATGSLGTVAGGKMKDYVRDLNASCWAFPNVGAQNSSNSSGWAGIGSGQRDDLGAYSGFTTDGYWWSANSVPTTIGNPPSNYNYLATRELKHWSNDVYKNIYAKSYGFSIRLVRPAVAGEVDGSTIFNAYKGNDGKLYDGIVIGTQVWLTKNLAEQNQNNGALVPGGILPAATWSTLLINNFPAHCYYDNIFANTSSLDGNIDPATGRCYKYPAFYIYQKCGGTETLIQEVSGSTLIPGKVQKAPDGTCWSFIEELNTNPTINASIYSLTNYFSGSNYVYNNCDECNAIHTIYTKFGTKNC